MGCSTPVSLSADYFISSLFPGLFSGLFHRLLHANCLLPLLVFYPARSRMLVNSVTYIDICYRAHLVDGLHWRQQTCQRRSCRGRDKGMLIHITRLPYFLVNSILAYFSFANWSFIPPYDYLLFHQLVYHIYHH